MKKLIPILAFFVGHAILTNAQVLSVGPDTAMCPGQNLTLNATLTPGPVPTNIPNIMGCDDCLSNAWIPLGFTFNFYGNNYTQCLVSSNSYITFQGTPSGGSPWSITVNLPNAGAPRNMIGAPWWDSNPAVLGTDLIRYKTIGTAPNRKFIVEFLNLPSFSCGASTCFGAQIHLYETTNVIETHIFRYESCTSWNNGRGAHGTHNAAGTIAHVVPGRNGLNAPWYINVPGFTVAPNSAGSEGRRWTPTSATNYNITTIPFAPIYMPNTLPAPGSINWSANGTPIGTGTSINVTPAGNTAYSASIPYSSCNGSVVVSDTMQVAMGNLTLNTVGNVSVCIGDTVQIWASTPAAGVTNYVWTPGGSLTNPNTDTTFAFPNTSTTYTVTASNSTCTNTATVDVTVNPLPVPNVLPANPQICQGESIDLTASGGTTYSWTPGASLSATTGATVTATPSVTTTYTVVVTDANLCSASTTSTVNFFNNPIVNVTAADSGVCLNFSTQLQANGALNYTWSPAGGLNFTNIANPVATPNASTTYQVIGEDANGCFDTADVTVAVYPNPVSAFSAPVTSGCAPLNVNLQDNSNISSGFISQYIWTVESMGNSNLQNPSFTFANPGIFDVSLITVSNFGCSDTLTMIDYLSSYSVPTAGFLATPNPATLGDALISFTNNSSLDAVNFNWDFDGLGFASGSQVEFNFAYADTFYVTMIATTVNGCSDTVTNFVIVEDVSEIWIPNSFTPNNDGLNEYWFPIGRNLDQGNTTIHVEVFDRWGMSVFYSEDVNKPWLGKMGGTQSDCPQDIYVYKIYFQNEKGKEFNYSGHITLIR